MNAIDIYQPDVSVVLGSELNPRNEGRITLAPDLVVQTVSSEPAVRLQHKTKALLSAGTRVVVVVYPEEREVLLYRASGIEQLTDSGVLRFDDILPGFAVPVASIFDGI